MAYYSALCSRQLWSPPFSTSQSQTAQCELLYWTSQSGCHHLLLSTLRKVAKNKNLKNVGISIFRKSKTETAFFFYDWTFRRFSHTLLLSFILLWDIGIPRGIDQLCIIVMYLNNYYVVIFLHNKYTNIRYQYWLSRFLWLFLCSLASFINWQDPEKCWVSLSLLYHSQKVNIK